MLERCKNAKLRFGLLKLSFKLDISVAEPQNDSYHIFFFNQTISNPIFGGSVAQSVERRIPGGGKHRYVSVTYVQVSIQDVCDAYDVARCL